MTADGWDGLEDLRGSLNGDLRPISAERLLSVDATWPGTQARQLVWDPRKVSATSSSSASSSTTTEYDSVRTRMTIVLCSSSSPATMSSVKMLWNIPTRARSALRVTRKWRRGSVRQLMAVICNLSSHLYLAKPPPPPSLSSSSLPVPDVVGSSPPAQ